jgi:hypothetical protein
MKKEKIYFVVITALDGNGSTIVNAAASIVADSPMVITCARVDHYPLAR